MLDPEGWSVALGIESEPGSERRPVVPGIRGPGRFGSILLAGAQWEQSVGCGVVLEEEEGDEGSGHDGRVCLSTRLHRCCNDDSDSSWPT